MHDGVADQHDQCEVKRVVVVSRYEVENAKLVMLRAMDQVCCLYTVILA